jgi:glycosyltransferase involved in cell wall biosynthesis
VIITLHDYWFVCSNTWLYRWNGALCPGPGLGYYCGGCAAHRLGLNPRRLLMALASPIFVARTAVLRRALLSADRLIAPSQIIARIFVRHGVPPDKLVVMPHGLSETLPPAREPAAPKHPLRFVYVGSLIPPKGAHVAIQAFNRLGDQSVQLHLYGDLTSDPGYVSQLRAQARHPGIEFKGAVDRGRVNDVLQTADVLLLPSLWYEAFSIIADEALSAGLPVLASDHGAAAERITPEQNGLTAPPGDVEAWHRQMQRLVDEPQLLACLRQRITPPKGLTQHIAEIESLYTHLLAETA